MPMSEAAVLLADAPLRRSTILQKVGDITLAVLLLVVGGAGAVILFGTWLVMLVLPTLLAAFGGWVNARA